MQAYPDTEHKGVKVTGTLTAADKVLSQRGADHQKQTV